MKVNSSRFLSALLVCIMLFPINVFGAEPPEITAETAILMEESSGKIIFDKNANKKMYPASMTKMITAMVVLDYLKPDNLVTVGAEINEVPLDSSKAGHKRGETLSVENLIRGLMIPSGNDTATVAASVVAKKVKNDENLSYEECEKVFAELMNEKAKKLGATDTHFNNPHGYHDENHYTTAYDMALIAREAMKNPIIKDIAAERSYIGGGIEEEQNTGDLIVNEYHWVSHNMLLTDNPYFYEYATGIKTGFTDEAGACLAASAEKEDKKLIAVICNSPDPERWTDAQKLFDYGFDNFSMVEMYNKGDVVEQVALAKHNRLQGDTLDVVVKEDVKAYIETEKKDNLAKVITYNQDLIAESKKDTEIHLKAPIAKDSEIGTLSLMLDGETLQETKLYAATDVEKSTIVSTIRYFFKNLFSNIFSLKGLIGVGAVAIVLLMLFIIRRIINNRRNRYKYTFRKRRHNKNKWKFKK